MRTKKTYFIGGPYDGHTAVFREGDPLRAMEILDPPGLDFRSNPPESVYQTASVREVEYEVALGGDGWQVAILPELFRRTYP